MPMIRTFQKVWRAVVILASSIACMFCGPNPDFDTIPKNALIVDVRTPDEYASKHFPGAVNIPLQDIEKRLSEFGDKNAEIVVYCHMGFRSQKAKQLLTEKGYTRVQSGGGIDDMLKMQLK
jgi:rhodanese-related sulfurtransferase